MCRRFDPAPDHFDNARMVPRFSTNSTSERLSAISIGGACAPLPGYWPDCFPDVIAALVDVFRRLGDLDDHGGSTSQLHTVAPRPPVADRGTDRSCV